MKSFVNLLLKFLKKTLPTLIFLLILILLFVYITKDGLRTTQKPIKIQIEGAVHSPGIKELNANAIYKDAIDAAGGYSENYDSQYVSEKINLVKKINDGDKIFIPFKKSEQLSNPESISVSGKININEADAKQLDQLPGIGAVTAQKIISGRPYKALNDLLTKKIVSNSTFIKIQSQIEI